ncbi:MAG: hypothetical protein PHO15_02730 [Eubacteriales bacterium]|nr:hypothetical protein [Eubacteriales bacterium]
MKTNDEKKLEKERQKLESLVDEALKKGTPISQTYDIMNQCEKINRMSGEKHNVLQDEEIQKQSRRVDVLFARVQKQRGES